MKNLQISSDLSLPVDAVTQTIVVYGMKGMGKTNFGSVFAEELYAAHQRFSVIDPMGVWWGLQHGTKRGEPGLEVLLLGGIHGDLPIEPTAGEVVADLVADESISVVVDISRRADGKAWTKGEKVRFVTAYMTRLYERQVEHRRPMMQIIDEAARYAPQKFSTGETDVAKCLGAIAMVCEEGRNLGIGLTLLTQRSARLNKDVAELADVMIAFRTVGPNSVGAILDWFGEHVPKERHKALVEELRRLPVGTALLVSPGWLEFEGSVALRARRTFDSSATPKGGGMLQAPGRASKPDLEKYRSRMAETIEQAKANDPKELKKQIAELKRDLAGRERQLAQRQVQAITATDKSVRVEVPVIKPAEVKRVESAISNFNQTVERFGRVETSLSEFFDKFHEARSRVTEEVRKLGDSLERATAQPAPPAPALSPTRPRPPQPHRPPRTEPSPTDNGDLEPRRQKILDAIAELNSFGIEQPSRIQVAYMCGRSSSSGGWNNDLGFLHNTRHFIYYPSQGMVALTADGRDVAREPASHTSLADYHQRIFSLMEPRQVEILKHLIAIHPDTISREELAEVCGRSAGSGGWNNDLGRLRNTLEVIEYPSQGMVRASKLLFPEGLR